MTRRIRIASESGSSSLDGLTEEEDRLFTAVSFGKLHKVLSLLPHLRDLEVRDQHLHTPLLHAALNARDDHLNYLTKLLLRGGSDVNAQDGNGQTPLMLVVRRGERQFRPGVSGEGSVDALRTLMRCRLCEPGLADRKGNTALIHAAEVGNADALAILLFPPNSARGMRHEAHVDVRNNEGLTALDVAVKHRNAACCRMLAEEGKADVESVKDAVAFRALMHEAARAGPSRKGT